MAQPRRPLLEFDANKAVATVCGAVFVAVTLWLGESVHEMTHKIERLSTAFEYQAEIMRSLAEGQQNLSAEVVRISQEQFRWAGELQSVAEIKARLTRLEVRMARLEPRPAAEHATPEGP